MPFALHCIALHFAMCDLCTKNNLECALWNIKSSGCKFVKRIHSCGRPAATCIQDPGFMFKYLKILFQYMKGHEQCTKTRNMLLLLVFKNERRKHEKPPPPNWKQSVVCADNDMIPPDTLHGIKGVCSTPRLPASTALKHTILLQLDYTTVCSHCAVWSTRSLYISCTYKQCLTPIHHESAEHIPSPTSAALSCINVCVLSTLSSTTLFYAQHCTTLCGAEH